MLRHLLLNQIIPRYLATTGRLVGIRLFPDSVNAVFTESSGFTNYTPYTDKQQLFLKSPVDDKPPVPCVLDAMFLLNDPKEAAFDDISITPAFISAWPRSGLQW